MALTQGRRLSLHEIVAAPSAGGGGEVYHARDPRLDWILTVAISVVAAREHVR